MRLLPHQARLSRIWNASGSRIGWSPTDAPLSLTLPLLVEGDARRRRKAECLNECRCVIGTPSRLHSRKEYRQHHVAGHRLQGLDVIGSLTEASCICPQIERDPFRFFSHCRVRWLQRSIGSALMLSHRWHLMWLA